MDEVVCETCGSRANDSECSTVVVDDFRYSDHGIEATGSNGIPPVSTSDPRRVGACRPSIIRCWVIVAFGIVLDGAGNNMFGSC